MEPSVQVSKRDPLSWVASPEGGRSEDAAGGAGDVASVWQGFQTLVPLCTSGRTLHL